MQYLGNIQGVRRQYLENNQTEFR